MASYVKATRSLLDIAQSRQTIEQFKLSAGEHRLGDMLFSGIVKGTDRDTVDIQTANGMLTFLPIAELFVLVDSVNEIMSRLDG